MIRKRYYQNLNGLRTIAAIGIAILHVYANMGYQIDGFLYAKIIPTFGNFVFLFMMLSAFSMCCGYYDEILNNKIDIVTFYKKRIIRIYPFFALLVLIDLLLNHNLESLYEAFADLTMFFGFLPNPEITVIGVGWTLGIIFIFYMIFPFFCFLIKDKKTAIISIIVSIVMYYIYCVYFVDSNHVIEGFTMKNNFIYCFPYFLVGGFLFINKDKLFEISNRHKILIRVLIIVSSFLFAFSERNLIFNIYYFSLLIIYAIGNNSKLLNNRITKSISDVSFEFYLSHMVWFRFYELIGITKLNYNKTVVFYIVLLLVIVSTYLSSYAYQKICRYILSKRKRMNN